MCFLFLIYCSLNIVRDILTCFCYEEKIFFIHPFIHPYMHAYASFQYHMLLEYRTYVRIFSCEARSAWA